MQQSNPTLVLSLMPLWALELRCRVLMTPSGGGAFTMAELTIWGIHRKSCFLGTCRQQQTGVGKHESQSFRKVLNLMHCGKEEVLAWTSPFSPVLTTWQRL